MKKVWMCVLSVVLIVALSGCGGGSIPGFEGGSGNSSTNNENPSSGSGSTDTSGGSAQEIRGFVGDTLTTAFFDWQVQSVEEVSEYAGYTPADGTMFVVVQMTIHNTQTSSIPMFDNDFALWVDVDKAYTQAIGGSLCTDYELGINDTASGDLVFQVTQAAKDCSVDFVEVFQDESYGDSYAVYFTLSGSGTASSSGTTQGAGAV